jgi:DNA polymerase elongation subunit (family B)
LLNVHFDRDELVLIGREGGAITRHRVPAEPVCWIEHEHMTRSLARMMRDSYRVKAMARQDKWWRIVWADRQLCEESCSALHSKGIPTCEGSVSPLRSWCADNQIQIAKPRRVYLDIETDSRLPFSRKEEMRVLAWALVDEQGNHTERWLLEDTDEAEAMLLDRLWCGLELFDQVLSWNGNRFDFPVIKARTKLLRLDVDTRRWLWLDHMDLFRRYNTMAAESGDEKQSMALQAIATKIVGEGKDDFDASKTWEAWVADGEERARMVRYCVKDTDLMRRIEAKTGYVELLQTLCEATGTFPDSKGVNPGAQVENFLLRLGRERGYRFPTRFAGGSTKYRGAYVMEPKGKGILRDVHVCDFSSLYPSIILTWNMSPETKGVGDERSKAAITDVEFATDREGILPVAVAELLRLRKAWNERKGEATPGTEEWKDADRRSTAYKIAANTFYGVIGAPLSRLFDREVAESVAQCGVWLIQETIKAAEAQGMTVVYADTDGAYVTDCGRAAFDRFVEWCNVELYPPLLAARGCKLNHIHLAYEKAFDRIVFTRAKRYAGAFSHYKGTVATAESKPEIKGLEFKRGDSVRFARELQEEIVYMLVGYQREPSEDPIDYEQVANRWRTRILDGEIELSDVVIAKRLTKAIDDYSVRIKKDGERAAQLPHIEIARVLRDRGRDVGEGVKIAYVCVDGGRSPKQYIPAEDWQGTCDRHELWDSLVWPPTKRVLEAAFPGHGWERWDKTRPKKRRGKRAPPEQERMPWGENPVG